MESEIAKPNYNVMHCPMFWCSMTPQQEAIDRFTGELEDESQKLGRLMLKWVETGDETLLEAFAEAAPAYVDKSLAALGLSWPKVQEQLKIWANMARLNSPEAEAKLLKLTEETEPVWQASILITEIWPRIKRTLKKWNESADAVGMNRAEFGRLNPTQRERKLYAIGWHPTKGLPADKQDSTNTETV